MNYTEYEKYKKDNRKIESVESNQYLCNAMKIQQNIKNVKALTESERSVYPIDPIELLPKMEKDKEFHIDKAIENLIDIDEAEELFGVKKYKKMLDEIMESQESTIATMYEK